MTTDAKCWPDKLHPEDAQRVFSELGPLIEQGGGTVEYRFQHRDGPYVWIQDTFKVVYQDGKSNNSEWPSNVGRPLELVGALGRHHQAQGGRAGRGPPAPAEGAKLSALHLDVSRC
jgi:hypothetical protein